MDWSNISFSKVLRAAALAVNGVEPVEPNPKFLDQLVQAAGSKGVVLYDEIGGTLQPTSTFGSGKVSRSLLATYQVSLLSLRRLNVSSSSSHVGA